MEEMPMETDLHNVHRRRKVIILAIAGVVVVMVLAVGAILAGALVYSRVRPLAALASNQAAATGSLTTGAGMPAVGDSAPDLSQAAATGVLTGTAQDVGIVVVHVNANSPAAKAGLQRGDIITAVDGQAVNTMQELLQALQSKKAGDTVTLAITRGGAAQSLQVTLAQATTQNSRTFFQLGFAGFPGASRQGPGPKARGQYQGEVVVQVSSGSPAEAAGVKSGDVITAVNSQAVDQNHTLQSLIASHKPGDSVQLSIQRSGQNLTLTATLAANPSDASKGYLGVQVRPNGFGFPGRGQRSAPQGPVTVLGIQNNSPAQTAGLQQGDVITAVDGQSINDFSQFRQILAGHKAGDTIKLSIQRGNQNLELSVTLGAQPWLGATIGPGGSGPQFRSPVLPNGAQLNPQG